MTTADNKISQCEPGIACQQRRFTGWLLLQLAGVFLLLVSYALPWIDMRPLASSTISGFGAFGFSAGMVLRLGPDLNSSEIEMAFAVLKVFCILFVAPVLAVIGGVCALRNKSCGTLIMASAGAYFLAWSGYDFVRHGFSFKATQFSGVVGVVASLALAVPYMQRFKLMAKVATIGERCSVQVPNYASNAAVAGMVVFLLGGIGFANLNLAFSNKPAAEDDAKTPAVGQLLNKLDAPPPAPPLALAKPIQQQPMPPLPGRQEPVRREFVPVILGGDPAQAKSLWNRGYELEKQKNYSEAARLYERSAEMGDLDAQVAIAAAYDAGKGVPQDSVRAAGWYRYAAERGDSFAQYAIGQMYRLGDGVPKDTAKAIDWLEKSAEQGPKLALFELGEMYEAGDGVPRDYARAYELYLGASENGNEKADQRLEELELKLSAEDREVIELKQKLRRASDYEE